MITRSASPLVRSLWRTGAGRDFRSSVRFIQLLWLLILFPGLLWAGIRDTSTEGKKVGVLLVNHGSRSQTWRNALTSLEESVRPEILRDKRIGAVSTAFMEYTEPSIATKLREFDAEGYTDVVIVPVFLTVSSHTFDDIPTIIGQKEDASSLQSLKIEKIERYTPRARVHITPTLDFAGILKENILRRVKALSVKADEEALVLIAYGDATYESEWISLLKDVSDHVRQKIGISEHTHAWCGHLVHYDPRKTTDAITAVLEKRKTAIVVPVLVAHDEMFQVKIIGDGIANVPENKTRVRYKPDSILPDENVSAWVIDIARQYSQTALSIR